MLGFLVEVWMELESPSLSCELESVCLETVKS